MLGKLEELFASDSGAIRLQSDPQMSQEDIIFVLLTGRPRDASSEVEGDQQALATASSLAAGLLADRLLSETGILIIEDVQSIEWLSALTAAVPHDLQKYIHTFDLRDIKGRYDDIVFVVDKMADGGL